MERDLVVVGGSAGGIRAVSALLSELPTDLPAAVVVVLHRAPESSTSLASVLCRASTLPLHEATDGLVARPGHVYLAPPGRHLLINDEALVLATTARVNRVRPAVDPLFRSAARWYGPRVIGVVVSGALDDGAAGLAAIQARDGLCLVQEPAEALFAGMPTAALAAVPAAKPLPIVALAAAVSEVAGRPVDPPAEQPDAGLVAETELAEHGPRGGGAEPFGVPVKPACPECRGGMTRVDVAHGAYYRCHVGHAYGPESLLAAQTEGTESALWTAVSILEEQETIHRGLAGRPSGAAEHHRQAAERAAAAAEGVRAVIAAHLAPDRAGRTTVHSDP